MKKLIFFVVLLISFFVPCFSYSSKKNIKDSDMIVLEGSVKCYGNEPFVYLGITTEDDAFYKNIIKKYPTSDYAIASDYYLGLIEVANFPENEKNLQYKV